MVCILMEWVLLLLCYAVIYALIVAAYYDKQMLRTSRGGFGLNIILTYLQTHHHYIYNDTIRHRHRTGPVLHSGTCRSYGFRSGWFSESSSSLGSPARVYRHKHSGEIHNKANKTDKNNRSCRRERLSHTSSSVDRAISEFLVLMASQQLTSSVTASKTSVEFL